MAVTIDPAELLTLNQAIAKMMFNLGYNADAITFDFAQQIDLTVASPSQAGSMSTADKAKLDALDPSSGITNAALLPGRAGGQILTGSPNTLQSLTLQANPVDGLTFPNNGIGIRLYSPFFVPHPGTTAPRLFILGGSSTTAGCSGVDIGLVGGNGFDGNPSNPATVAGRITLTGGLGGNGTATAPGGNGGNIVIHAGTGGNTGGAGFGNPGKLGLYGGSASNGTSANSVEINNGFGLSGTPSPGNGGPVSISAAGYNTDIGGSLTIAKFFNLPETTTPANPTVGTLRCYAKSNGIASPGHKTQFIILDSTGVETVLYESAAT
jgi:hypothetical protein